MNNLSWFIYLTQVVDNVQGFATGILVAGIIAVGAGAIFGPLIGLMLEEHDINPPFRAIFKWYVLTMLIAGAVSIFTPDRRTMLLVAGSEIGERAINSQGAHEIINPGMDLLKTWIKRETEKLSKEASK